ncbi:MAG: hypothetical protein ACE5HO_15900 [bacterium]
MNSLLRFHSTGIFILCTLFWLSGCGNESTTEVFFNGRKIIVKGGTSHSTVQEEDALEIVIDSHHVILSDGQLTLNGVSSPIPDFKEMLLKVEGGFVHVELDGEEFLMDNSAESRKIAGARGASENARGSIGWKAQTSKKEPALPRGFIRAKRSSGTGEVLYIRIPNSRSATQQLVESLDRLSPYFDDRLTSFEGFRDHQDQQAQTTFWGSFGGDAIAGVAVSSVQLSGGIVGVVFDRRERLANTINPLMATLEKTVSSAGGAQPRKRQTVNWHTAYLPDGSGQIRLPERWRITSSYKGAVDVAGAEGERMSLGIGLPVATPEAATNPLTGTRMSGALVSYPTDPINALRTLSPQIAQFNAQFNPQAPQISDVRIIESSPVQSPTNGRAAFVLYDVGVNGAPYRVLSFIDCSPAVAGYWTFYYSTVTAPVNQFAAKLPIMLQAWSNWNVNPQVFQERLNRAISSMKQTYRLLNEANQYRQRTFDNTLADWTEVFRGTRIVRDTRTGEQAHTDIGWVDQTVQALNERAGYQRFEQIPLRAFNRR